MITEKSANSSSVRLIIVCVCVFAGVCKWQYVAVRDIYELTAWSLRIRSGWQMLANRAGDGMKLVCL